ncbi:topless-related protein 4-like isoform X2 [Tripterygium wilfordii]|uniref:topless-related protein 4-like isoform X2 n=1 Tax=Tripterygium wilfordii TaxID=458696 RepID=UPI0018F81D19|nr:topless-related protein 4-like isoform X2 [Tripterygium wilfordii]
MASLSRELVFLILQFLDEEKFKETVHVLEQDSGFFFNIGYFEDLVKIGEWEQLEKYLSGFTKVDDNRYSMKIFFEIRKQKYLEALDRRDRAKAVDILVKDLKVFSAFNEELFKEITQLMTLENFRNNEQLSKYEDTKSARAIMVVELKKLIEANPIFRDKLQFPELKSSRLRMLINQSLNWQHQLCKNPRPNPDIKTLFVDHICGQLNGARAPSPVTNTLMGVVPKAAGGFPSLSTHNPFQPAPAALPTSLVGWMANPSPVSHPTASSGPIGLTVTNNADAAILKRPRTPPTNKPAMDYQTEDTSHMLKRSRPFGISDEVNNLPVNILPNDYASRGQGSSSDGLPKTVVMSLNQGSPVKSMDFHPLKPNLLIVGTNKGDVMVWELVSQEKIALKNFKVRDLGACSMVLQESLANDYTASVNRVIWSPDGAYVGIAYSKHIVHTYHGDDLQNHLEIEAHVGSVNDLAFSYPNKQLCIVTCGDDRAIKVWDADTGVNQYTFEGHEAIVYSVCPHYQKNIQFIFSTDVDGKIKAWLYDTPGSRVDYDAPGHSSTKMAYSGDGKRFRLFSCGTNKEGESYLVEWNESKGEVKRTYIGLGKRSAEVVQFDTTKNRFLAAGDEFTIKFWDMDNDNQLTSTDADGGLPASPCIRFNKDGILLAVSTNDNGVKILANADGIRLLRIVENRTFDASRAASAAVVKASATGTFGSANSTAGPTIGDKAGSGAAVVGMNNDDRSFNNVKPRIADESVEKSRFWKLTEVNEPSQCRSLRLPDNLQPAKVCRLIYTNSGLCILALASNGMHKLWKWQKNDRMIKATASIVPQLWQHSSGILMTNDLPSPNLLAEDVSCFALSKNDSYVMSASGGKISLFNMLTFKTMTTFMSPPPAATFLAFHPQDNNIIAIGMEDSSIQIYNVRVDEVKTKLNGHQRRITGLAFSNFLNVLVSSGADNQLCVWSTDVWEKHTSGFLQLPTGRPTNPHADTRVQFHNDQIHLLAVHETQIALYEAPKLGCLKQWFPREASGPISHASYSCDSQSIYVCFKDGSIGALTASTLRLRCRISAAAYMTSTPKTYPVVIAAHPSDPNQFALGLSDGGVHVLEPSEAEGKWGTAGPIENSFGPNATPGTGGPEQAQR